MNGRRGRRAVTTLGVAVVSLIAASAPAAYGQFLPGLGCSDVPGGDGQGATGGTTTEVCQGAGVVFIGPQVGQVATVIGPTVIGPVAGVGSINTSAGGIAGNTGSSTVPLL